MTQGGFTLSFQSFFILLTLERRVRALNSSDNAAGSGFGSGFRAADVTSSLPFHKDACVEMSYSDF